MKNHRNFAIAIVELEVLGLELMLLETSTLFLFD